MNGMWKGGKRAALAAAGLGVAGSVALRLRPGADLHGEVALITGGSRGLGLLLAREFGRQGCKVAICARDQGELAKARELLEQWCPGIEVHTAVCDVTDQAQVGRLVSSVTKRFGPIDVLVNNAGIIEVGPVQQMTRKDYERALDLMFWALFNTTQAVLPKMQERGYGRIVNITSVGGKISVPHLLPYNCAKFAAVGFSEGLRAELADQGIIVTTICPGEMRTGSFMQAEFKGRREAEYTWFAASSSLPLMSMDAERAARQVVAATRRGEAERILSLPASLAARFHGLFPGATANLLGVVDRFLPQPAPTNGAVRGDELMDRAGAPPLRMLTTLGRRAARRFNEVARA